jgi:hypothetical protein
MKYYNIKKYGFILVSSLCVTFFANSSTPTQSYADIVTHAQLFEVANTLSEAQIKHILMPDNVQKIVASSPKNILAELQSAALLKQLDCIDKVVPIKSTSQSKCIALAPLTLMHTSISKKIISPLNLLLRNNVIQGYNVKRNNSDTQNNTAKSPTLIKPKQNDTTILYGHSSLIHAKQLIVLLKLHHVNFTWQLLEKTSAFNIRAGWNDISVLEMTEKIRYAQEYDLLLTFDNHQDKLHFMPIVNRYAKRNSQSNHGLIIDAWWQPFYRSFVNENNYKQVTRINVVSGEYTASTLVLNHHKDEVFAKIKKRLSDHSTVFTLSIEHIWVNPAFYRYLTGEYQ